jgi:hypothetical protein
VEDLDTAALVALVDPTKATGGSAPSRADTPIRGAGVAP